MDSLDKIGSRKIVRWRHFGLFTPVAAEFSSPPMSMNENCQNFETAEDRIRLASIELYQETIGLLSVSSGIPGLTSSEAWSHLTQSCNVWGYSRE